MEKFAVPGSQLFADIAGLVIDNIGYGEVLQDPFLMGRLSTPVRKGRNRVFCEID